MPSKQSKNDEVQEVAIQPIKNAAKHFTVVGLTPLLCNRMSEKTRRILLLGEAPGGRKSQAARSLRLKHNPYEEFQDSPYTYSAPTAPTVLATSPACFKGAMMSAALDLPGSSKAQIGRLLWVEGDPTLVPVYGKPWLFMAITRSADRNNTPDVRTRCAIWPWAATITISYVEPLIKLPSVTNLLHASGRLAGVGDWRPQRGKGNYGQYEVTDLTDPRVQDIMHNWGRAQQVPAMLRPECLDDETMHLLTWFDAEAPRRGFAVSAEGEMSADVAYALASQGQQRMEEIDGEHEAVRLASQGH